MGNAQSSVYVVSRSAKAVLKPAKGEIQSVSRKAEVQHNVTNQALTAALL